MVLVIAAAAAGTWLTVSPSSPLKPGGSTTTTAAAIDEIPGGDDPLALDVLGPGVAQPAVTGWFDLGDPIQLATGTVGPEGGVIAAPDGLLIGVPPGAHRDPVGYDMRAQEILGHGFGPGLNPVSMMYTVDNGGGYADDAIWVEVPAAVPDGGFAMGFLYDPATGGLEALPLVGVGDGKVVVVTSHFSQFFVHGIDPATLAATVASQTAGDTQSSLGPTILVNTGFRPGVDDWPFTNYGSYVSPGGHCAGQALSAMWYFTEQAARGRPSLHTAFDNDGYGPTARWQDDRNGYRLASTVQIDYSWRIESWSDLFQRWLQKWRLEAPVPTAEQDIDLWQFAAFVTAMTITGEPQYVSIARLDKEGKRRGHAMVVYGADTRGLWVADPNYPGRFRRIPWDAATSTLGPYFSGEDATNLGRQYDAIVLLGKTSQVDWSRLGLRFTQLGLGVAGDDVFPGYTLMVLEPTGAGGGRWVLLEDGYSTTATRILVRVTSPEAGPRVRVTECPDTDRNCPQPVLRMVGVDLDEGENTIELYLEARADGDLWRYLDFARVTVHRATALDVTVIPATQVVGPGEDASFTIEVTNLGTTEFRFIDVEVDPGGRCPAAIGLLPGLSTHRYDCTLTPPPQPGDHEYSVIASGTRGRGTEVVERIIYTRITVGEPVDQGSDIIAILDRLRQEEFGGTVAPGEGAWEVPLDNVSMWSNGLAPNPTPQAVYRSSLVMPIYVGVYATPEEAGAALQAAADAASAKVLDNTGAGVHWCEWRRISMQRRVFHGEDGFVLTTTFKTVDTDTSEPGIQYFGQPADGWCAYTEAQVPTLGWSSAAVVETFSEDIGWVQGRLMVTMNPAWGQQTAERLHAALQRIPG